MLIDSVDIPQNSCAFRGRAPSLLRPTRSWSRRRCHRMWRS